MRKLPCPCICRIPPPRHTPGALHPHGDGLRRSRAAKRRQSEGAGASGHQATLRDRDIRGHRFPLYHCDFWVAERPVRKFISPARPLETNPHLPTSGRIDVRIAPYWVFLASVTAVAMVLCTVPAPLAGQNPNDPGQRPVQTSNRDVPSLAELGLLPGRPRVTPTRTDTPPEIDGMLDDEIWLTATHVTEFTQQSPFEGEPPSEETDVYIAYDSDNLYFAFRAHYKDPSIMRANRVDRDRASMDDLMTVYFDTFMDQQRGYDFDVNGYGVQGDGIMSAARGGGRGRGGSRAVSGIPPADRSWDALFETGARIVEDGFVAEMAIPFKSLRYPMPPEGEPHRWGFQIVREIKSRDFENDVWAPMTRDETSFFAQMGVLEGMTDLSTSRNMEILPTFTAIQYGEIDPTRPGFENQDADPDAGVNIKYGITSDLTADFTVNPDFSQIESDRPQIEVNQRFPLFFSELRPFFVEGAEIFNIQAPVTFVHTRTIVDPDYGAKLTGQVGRFSLGLLTANDVAPGRLEDPADVGFEKTAQTVIGRVRYDLYAESNVGAIFTDREFVDSHSRLIGADGNFRLSPTIGADFRAVGSFFKDVGENEVDGHMFQAGVRRSSRFWSWGLTGYEISPEFATEVGFVRRTDTRRLEGNLGYRFWPETWLIDWGPQLTLGRTYDFDDVLQDENLSARVNFSFARNISLNASFDQDLERFGGIDFTQRRISVGGSVNTNRRYQFGGNISFGNQIFFAGPFLSDQFRWSVNGTLRPLDRLQTSLNFTSSQLTNPNGGGAELFDIKIIRSQNYLQLTDRLGLRNITEWNTEDQTFDLNFLFNYRVNAGTVFFLGYDDHYQQADLIEGDRDGDGIAEQLFFRDSLRRTNRAIFVKLQYLLRY